MHLAPVFLQTKVIRNMPDKSSSVPEERGHGIAECQLQHTQQGDVFREERRSYPQSGKAIPASVETFGVAIT